jgi:hypothetical protein
LTSNPIHRAGGTLDDRRHAVVPSIYAGKRPSVNNAASFTRPMERRTDPAEPP